MYAYKTSDIWRQDAKDTASVITEGGYVKGSVYWNNNSPADNQITVDLASREKQYDPGMPGVTVYASYLSDYAVAQLNSAEVLEKFVDESSKWQPVVNKDKSSNIRSGQWTQANEDKLRAYILEQVTANRAQWIAETVKTQTDGNGDFALQFNGTFGEKWNNPGFKGLISSRDTVLRSESDVVNTETGETKKGTEWNGVVAPSASYGSWTTQGADSKTDLSKASKHVNTDWIFVTTEEKEGVSFYTPFYGDVPKGGTGLAPNGKWQLQGTGTRWDVVIRDRNTAGLNNDSITNVYFAAVNDVLKFDIYNYDSYSHFAAPGDTAKVKTTGLTPNLGETYKIVWKDEDGKIVKESTPLTVNPDGSLPESEFTVPADLEKTTVYFAELYALGKGNVEPTYPIQKDSFTAVYQLIPKYEVTYADQGATNTTSANPTFDVAHTKDKEETLAAPDGATFSFVSKDGSDAAPTNFSIDAKTGVITWKNATEDTTVDVLVTYKDGTTSTVTAEFKLNHPETETDRYTPAYTDTEVKAGQSATSAVPTFTDKDGASATPAASVAYKLGDTSGLPAGVTATIDSATGMVTVKTPDGLAAGTEINVPVVVTYKDKSEDTATAKFTVVESDKDNYTPTYEDTHVKAGTTATSKVPTFTDKNGATATPANVKYELGEEAPDGAAVDPTTGVVTLPIGDSAGFGTEFTVPVKVTYPDGSSEEVKAKIIVIESDNDKYTPAYTDVTGKPGETVTTAVPTFTPELPADAKKPIYAISTEQPDGTTPLPAGTKATVDADGKVSVTVPSGATPGTDYTIPVEVTYGDGSKEVVPVKVTVAEPDKDTTKPTIEPIEDQTVTEGKDITPITVTTNDDSGTKPTVTVLGLPDGVTYDSKTGVISGKPTVEDWGDAEEKEFPVTVKATDEAGNETSETFVIKVRRDTDKDGTPDVTDPDDDGDGFTDEDEKKAGTDSKDPDSKPSATIDGVSDKIVVEGQPIDAMTVTTANVPEGGITEVTGLPDGVTYDPKTGVISGTPTVGDWGTDEEKTFTVTVKATDEAGNETTETFVIKVQRDTDKDGDPDVTDPDDDGDGSADAEEKKAGTNSKDPTSKPAPNTDKDKDTTNPTIAPITDQTVVEGKSITPITVTATDDSGKAPTITASGLPDGVTYNPATGVISGTPTVGDWGTDEEKTFTVTVKAKDEAGNETTETFVIKVQRDTDKDGDPDVTDPDDDGDGFTDAEEKDAGTDPKDSASKPSATIDGVSDKTVIEGQPIEPITVTTANVPTDATTEVIGLPDGVTYNPATGVISGTPTKVTDWSKDEETREFPITVVVKDKDGKVIAEKPFIITIQRDTDGDGNPDVTDPDDDNDGFTDDAEKDAGTDSKDPNSKPASDTDKDTTADKPSVTANEDGSVTVKVGEDNTTGTIDYTDEDGSQQTVTIVKDPTTGEWTPKGTLPDGVMVDKDGTVTIPADKVADGSTVTATGKDAKGNVAKGSAVAKPNQTIDPGQKPPTQPGKQGTDPGAGQPPMPGQSGPAQAGSTTVKPSKGALPRTGTETSTIGVYGLIALGLADFLALGKSKREDKE